MLHSHPLTERRSPPRWLVRGAGVGLLHNAARILLGAVLALAAARAGWCQSPHGAAVFSTAAARDNLKLVGISDQWRFRFEDEQAKPVDVDHSQLVVWGRRVEQGRGPIILLADGGQIVGDLLGIDSNSLSVGLDYSRFSNRSVFEPSRVPLSRVAAVLLRPPADALQRDLLIARLRAMKGAKDLLVLRNGDQLEGTLNKPAPEITNDTADADEPSRVFRLGTVGGDATAPYEHVAAVVFNPTLRESGRPRGSFVWVGFRDGSFVAAKGVRVDAALATIELTGGVKLTAKSRAWWRRICYLQSTAAVDYMSDLPTIGYRHIPFFGDPRQMQLDRNIDGGLLRADGAVFTKGLGLKSACRVAYQLDDSYSRFETELAIDSAANELGSVRCRIFLDRGDGRFQVVHTSPIVRGGEPPTPLSVDVGGAKRLAILVEYAERGDLQDNVNLLNARLVRKASR